MCIAREGEELLQVVHVHDDVVFAACSSCFDPATVVFILSSRSLGKLGYGIRDYFAVHPHQVRQTYIENLSSIPT